MCKGQAIEENIEWEVGEWARIDAINDRWCSAQSIEKLQDDFDIEIIPLGATVSDPITQDKEWDVEKLEGVGDASIREAIMRIPIPKGEGEDKPTWGEKALSRVTLKDVYANPSVVGPKACYSNFDDD